MSTYNNNNGYYFSSDSTEKKCQKCLGTILDHQIIQTDTGWGLCYLCITDFNDCMEIETKVTYRESDMVNWTPKDIVKYLDQYIIGQEDAKKTLALAAYQHYKLRSIPLKSGERIDKANVLMLGSTGSGKTALVEMLATFLDVPFVIYDATQITESGYVGDDIGDVVTALWQKADQNLEKAQRGIICLDEIDKVNSQPGKTTRDIGGYGVQRSLLKTLESNVISFTEDGTARTSNKHQMHFDTTNVLFIATGAFSTIPEIIKQRITKDNSNIGFGAIVQNKDSKMAYDEAISQVDNEDLVKYGFMPEFLGRFSNITYTKSLTVDTMRKVLVEPKNSVLKQAKKLFLLDGVNLSFSQEALTKVAEMALSVKTGARALKNIVGNVLKQSMYEYPSNSDILHVKVDIDDKGEFVVQLLDVDNEIVGMGENEKEIESDSNKE